METNYHVIVYLCAPAQRQRDCNYYLSEQHRDCSDFLRQLEWLDEASFYQEDDVDSGTNLKDRRTLRKILKQNWWRGNNRRSVLIIPYYECLSTKPSELMAILNELGAQGLEVFPVQWPELYYWPYLRCGNAKGTKVELKVPGMARD